MAYLAGGLKSLLEAMSTSDEYSDLTIICGTRSFNVHKIIVCSQCKPFAAMVNGSWIESTAQTITLQDEDAEVVQDAITYLYTAGCAVARRPGSVENPPKKCSDPIHLTKLYIFGDKWNIPTMQQYVVHLWKRYIVQPRTYKVPDILEAISMVWRSILKDDDSLKLAIVDTVREDLENFHKYDGFIASLNQVPEASTAIINSVALHNNKYRMIEIPIGNDNCHCEWDYNSVKQCDSCRTLQLEGYA